MAFDAYIKRFFPGILLFLIALAAYFQASGVVQLVASAVFDPESETALGEWRPGTASAAPASQASRSAEPILSRNPFDSVTGPLNAEPIDPNFARPRDTIDLSDPLAAPDCGGVIVHIVTESPDPTWSIAVLQAPGEPTGKLRRVGDPVGDKQVAFIGFNPQRNSPSVWLANQAQLCQSLLFGGTPGAAPAPPQPTPEPAVARRAKRGAPPVPEDIASKIQKVSDTEFHVDRGVVDNIL
jgi:general secretion pathway protein C